MTRPPRIHHCTSEPLTLFGRADELLLLDAALHGGPSLVALVGPGGQGKTAIVQHWLRTPRADLDGLFFWSFYRGKDVDLCLREWLAYAEGMSSPPQVSASWCVDRLVAILCRERWAVVLDGAEVVQHESGPWAGRFVHPDFGRLLEELSSTALPGVVVLTTRFELPTLVRRPFARLVHLERLDADGARDLLTSLGVVGSPEQLDAVAHAAGWHAKAVELSGTYLAHFHGGDAGALEGGEAQGLRPLGLGGAPSHPDDLEAIVGRILRLFDEALPAPTRDILALLTAFHEPPTEALALDYLAGAAVRHLLHDTWKREYAPFVAVLPAQIELLVRLRLLERVGPGPVPVLDAHPLVRRGFEHVAGPTGRRESALARAGFLRGKPDRRRPETLEEAREHVEMFHAHIDAGLWNEADGLLVLLENPKHRLLAPALERDLLLRFFPDGDWRRPPLWPGFGRRRSLAISFELLGQFTDALAAYPPADAALRGDALLALGRLSPLLDTPRVGAPWETLWQAYRCHALCLAGRVEEAVRLARSLIPQDVYEWVHVFECLLRADRLDLIDPRSLQPRGEVSRWAEFAWRRMRADHARVTSGASDELGEEYMAIIDAYDRAGLVVERVQSRRGLIAWHQARGEDAANFIGEVRGIVRTHGLHGLDR